MIDASYCQLMAVYNQWMNAKLYGACTTLPEQELHADKGAFFKSIYLTLNHIAYSDLAFHSRFTGEPSQAPPLGETTLLTQQGMDVGSTDLPFMPRFERSHV